MSSFGKILNLLDTRHLNLQDVTGNVEPLPVLVPYENYTQNVIVYRMDMSHEAFMGIIQDFTSSVARQIGEELWTWCAQWDVVPQQTPKRSRLDSMQQQANRPSLPVPTFEQQNFIARLMKEEEMLRLLIDIIQAESRLVPNFIEFLYQWIDINICDGSALKAAVRGEIPSLWDFEYHPIFLKNGFNANAFSKGNEGTNRQENRESRITTEAKVAKPFLRTLSSTNTRQKPDLAALKRQNEEIERLEYCEVEYGIKPPEIENQPLPSLINIPDDRMKQSKYYSACFKSRQRALFLLLEAGVTLQQIRDYKKSQKAHPKHTPIDPDGDGLEHYLHDSEFGQGVFTVTQNRMLMREKQREIAISNDLALEAQLAALSANIDQSEPRSNSFLSPSLPPPLIPPTPTQSSASRLDVSASVLSRLQSLSRKRHAVIRPIPQPVFSNVHSRLFVGSRHTITRSDPTMLEHEVAIPHRNTHWTTEVNGDDQDIDMENIIDGNCSLNGDENGEDERDEGQNTAQSNTGIIETRCVPVTSPSQLTSVSADSAGIISDLRTQSIQQIAPVLNQRAQDTQSFSAQPPSSTNVTMSSIRIPSHLPAPMSLIAETQTVHPIHTFIQSSSSASRSGLRSNLPLPLVLDAASNQTCSIDCPTTLPFATSSSNIPIQVYIPKVLIPRGGLGIGAGRLFADGLAKETDALMLGHTKPGSGKLVLTKAIFLPVGVWKNTLRGAILGTYKVLETYRPLPTHPGLKLGEAAMPDEIRTNDFSSHQMIYTKLMHAFSLISSSKNREEDLTKRWRVTRGPMSMSDRGSIWEGWAVHLDEGIEMSAQERRQAVVGCSFIDNNDEAANDEKARRMGEMDVMMDEDNDE